MEPLDILNIIASEGFILKDELIAFVGHKNIYCIMSLVNNGYIEHGVYGYQLTEAGERKVNMQCRRSGIPI